MKRILSFLLIILIGVGVVAYIQYTEPVAAEVEGVAEISITAEAVLAAYLSDEHVANGKFLGKNMEVLGVVAEVVDGTINLDTGDPMVFITCGFAEGTDLSKIQVGMTVKVQGSCDGFSGFDVQLSKCRIVEQ